MSLRLPIHIFLICTFCAATVCMNGQSFFINLPDVGGIGMRGVCRAVVPLDSTFAVIGHRYDTIGPGSDVKPWLGNFTYDGEMISLFQLIDSLYEEPFYPNTVNLCHKEGDLYYAYMPRLIGLASYYTPYLFEFNIKTGEILRSKLIPNEAYPEMPNSPISVHFENNIIMLLSSVTVDNIGTLDSIVVFITELDTLFNSLNFTQAKSHALRFYPKHIFKDTDSTYQLIGVQYVESEEKNNFWNFGYLRIDTSGNPLEEKLLPWEKEFVNTITSSRTIIQDRFNNWIISGNERIGYPDSCLNCAVYIPYIISVTNDFDSLLWQTRFFDIPYKVGPYYFLYSITTVEDGYITAGDFFNSDIDLYPDSGLLFKSALNGDSLWMKHYIPVGWSGDRVVQMVLTDIKTTPSGSVIAVGNLGDRDLNIIRPIIMHVDKDGCLVPGCNEITSIDDPVYNMENRFKIFPNPASQELYVLCRYSFQMPVDLHLINQTGIVVHRRSLQMEADAQYILPIDHLAPGIYHLVFKGDNNIVESHSFIKS